MRHIVLASITSQLPVILPILVSCAVKHPVDGDVEVEGEVTIIHKIESICTPENGYHTPEARRSCIEGLAVLQECLPESIAGGSDE